jgi:hypothetical protein
MPLIDRCAFFATSTGTVDFVVARAVIGYQTPSAAAAVDGATYSYAAQSNDLTQWEIGQGVYTNGTTTLARTVVLDNSLNTTAKINFSTVPQVMITALTADFTTLTGGATASSVLTLQSTSGAGTTDFIAFKTGSQLEQMRIRSDGKVIVSGGFTVNVFGQDLQILGVDGNSGFASGRWSANNAPAKMVFGKSRGVTIGTLAGVVNNDQLALIDILADDGTNATTEAANIRADVDGTVSAGIVPGRWGFFTSDTSGVSAERMRIASANMYVMAVATTAATTPLAIINNASTPANELLRSTSSLTYKTHVTEVPQSRLQLAQRIRPIEFNSIAAADDHDLRMVGFAAEDVAELDDRLVSWRIDEAGRKQPDNVNYISVLLLKVAALETEVERLKQGLH